MALYHLDPRQAGTGVAPTVSIREREPGERLFCWQMIDRGRPGSPVGRFKTEAYALRAAREAAGFGHVAETACDALAWPKSPEPRCGTHGWQTLPDGRCMPWRYDHAAQRYEWEPNRLTYIVECPTCAWPRDAHKEGGK